MIIRRPYAFLIKNFKLINFLIFIFSFFVLYKTYNTFDFFNEYATTRQFVESETLVSDTIPLTIVFLSLLLSLLCIAIVVLFKRKDKPTLLYLISVIFYIVLIICSIISRGLITTIIYEGLDPRISRIIRDFWFIGICVQVIIVGFSFIRAIGFDIKKFNFWEDYQELKITEEDDEEIEVATRFDSDILKIKTRMQIEEYKSFFYENKFIIILIAILLFIVIPFTFYAKSLSENKKYRVNEVINLKDFNFKIKNVYTTKKDYNGNTLLNGNNSYLIVKFNIENKKEEKRGINLNNLRLEVDNNIYLPKLNYYDYFIDLGNGYKDNEISKESKDYIAVYVIDDSILDKEMIIRYADKLTIKNKEATAKYYRTIIEPENIDINRNNVNKSIGEELSIESIFMNINLNVSHYALKDKFTYEVDDKTKYIINSTGLVLYFKYDYSGNISFSDFMNKYVTIRYKYNNCTYTQEINNITPTNTKNEVYLSTTESLKDASQIDLVINVRNTEYVYKLK